MYHQKEKLIPSFFKHLRDTNLMDVLYKFVEKEATSAATFKDFDPKKQPDVVGDTLFWTDDIPDLIIAQIKKEDHEWSDVEIESMAHFVGQILEKFPNCKLAYQFRDMRFCQLLVSHAFTYTPYPTQLNNEVPHTNGISNGLVNNTPFRHQSTLVSLLNFITLLLKYATNTSSYTADTVPPIVVSLIYGKNGKGSPLEEAPVRIFTNRASDRNIFDETLKIHSKLGSSVRRLTSNFLNTRTRNPNHSAFLG